MTTTWTARPERPDDVRAIRKVNLAAFPTAAEADLVEALRASDAWIEGLSIVTEDPAGTVVGHALLTRCHVDGAPALALAPCAVLPRVQRSGAGSAAIRAGLEAARAMGGTSSSSWATPSTTRASGSLRPPALESDRASTCRTKP